MKRYGNSQTTTNRSRVSLYPPGFAKALALFCLILGISFRVDAANLGAQTITLDGRLLSIDGTEGLLDPDITIDVKIYDPGASCILYEQSEHITTITTEGRFTISVGSAVGATKRLTGYVLPMATIFQNASAIVSKTCTFTPASGDARLLRITVSPSTSGTTEVLAPDTTIDAVPNALVAETLQGLDRDHVLAIDSTSTLNQTNISNIFSSTNYPILTALLGGTSSQYVTSTSSGAKIPSTATTPSSPAVGQIWFSSSANAFQYYDGSLVQTLQSMNFYSTGSTATQWTTSGTGISYTGGKVGIGNATPGTTLDVNGGIRAGASTVVTATCNAATEGVERYNYSTHFKEYCNGSAWTQFTVQAAASTIGVSTSGPPTNASLYAFASASANYSPTYGSVANTYNGNWPAVGSSSVSNSTCVQMDPQPVANQYIIYDLGSLKSVGNIYLSASGPPYGYMVPYVSFSTDGVTFNSSVQPYLYNTQSIQYASYTLSTPLSIRYVRVTNGGMNNSATPNDTFCQIAVGP